MVRERTARPFASIDDLQLRVPAIQKDELVALAEIGALNSITGRPEGHRRDALWQVERASRRPGPLLESPQSFVAQVAAEQTAEERLSDRHSESAGADEESLRA